MHVYLVVVVEKRQKWEVVSMYDVIRFTGEQPGVVTDENGRSAEFDASMERTSLFMPVYLDRLLSAVSLQQGEPKAKIIRNAVLRELAAYIAQFEGNHSMRNAKPLQPFKPQNCRSEVMSDYEGNVEWVKELYKRYLKQEDKLPSRTALSKPRF